MNEKERDEIIDEIISDYWHRTWGSKSKMIISKEEMETILAMYEVTCSEGQETDAMINLAKRIKKRGEQ